MDSKTQEKKNAALKAVEQVQSGMTLGLGTGSTAYFAIEAIGEQWQAGTLTDIRAIPTSEATATQARSYGIPLVELADVDRIDLTIDGADEFDPHLRLIKGGGGALFREKLVAFASDIMLVISDASKEVEHLGAFPLPVEVLPKAIRLVERVLTEKGCRPTLRTQKDGTPYLTDNQNYILDCQLGKIADPERLDLEFHLVPGIVETGLFLGLATQVIVGQGDEIKVFG
ncbi:ribose-5-phosphate isomerase RpiA [Lewinella cohaerens]|uniref:ribose-5-phosphate isomerase RpiA n=1 Tax=Lewinella cohaerens TaxID=70995 RepID=UPI000368BA21|nr:ribose-5-phosphate isomerase RpiA [Lewinella cohaerens]